MNKLNINTEDKIIMSAKTYFNLVQDERIKKFLTFVIDKDSVGEMQLFGYGIIVKRRVNNEY